MIPGSLTTYVGFISDTDVKFLGHRLHIFTKRFAVTLGSKSVWKNSILELLLREGVASNDKPTTGKKQMVFFSAIIGTSVKSYYAIIK